MMPSGTVRWCGHHAAAGGVLLVHRQCPQRHPVERLERIAFGVRRVPVRGRRARGGSGVQLCVVIGRAAAHAEATGQHARRCAPSSDALLHHVPDPQQPRSTSSSGRRAHSLASMMSLTRSPLSGTGLHQFGASPERVRHLSGIRNHARLARCISVDDEAATDRVVGPLAERLISGVRGERHAVGMEREANGAGARSHPRRGRTRSPVDPPGGCAESA